MNPLDSVLRDQGFESRNMIKFCNFITSMDLIFDLIHFFYGSYDSENLTLFMDASFFSFL